MICVCKTCSKKFEKSNSQIKKYKNHFCSRSCSAIFNNTGKVKNPKKIKNCLLCCKPFWRHSKYCSNECSRIAIKTIRKKHSINVVLKKSKILKFDTICSECAGMCRKTKRQTENGKNVFCSKTCELLYRAKICQQRKNNQAPPFLLNNGLSITKGYLKQQTGFATNKWVKLRQNAIKVFKYYNNTTKCSCCGYDKHIEICHKKPIKDFDDSSLVSEINSKDNLTALCPNCHWEFDNKLLIL